MQTNANAWLKRCMLMVSVPLLLIAVFNYWLDPLWLFDHSNRWNNRQSPFDLRLQKVNYIAGHPFDYEALLLGSSRVAWINQFDFRPMTTYNFAVYAMNPEDYYIEFAKRKNGKPFQTILIGLDFDATNAFMYEHQQKVPLSSYIRLTEHFPYKMEALLSYATVKYSLGVLWNTITSGASDPIPYFSRDNVFHVEKPQQPAAWNRVLDISKQQSGGSYRYKDLTPVFQEIKKNNPDSRFIVFTTPVSQEMFRVLVTDGNYADYERWISDIVDSFGEVHHFMYENEVTRDRDNFYDAGHALPRNRPMDGGRDDERSRSSFHSEGIGI